MKFAQIWDRTTIKDYIKTQYGEILTAVGRDDLDDSIYGAISILIEKKISAFNLWETIYDTQQEGLAKIKDYINRNLVELMTEVYGTIRAIKTTNVSSQHTQRKVFPIQNGEDQEDIDNEPVALDTATFTVAENILNHTELLCKNSVALQRIYNLIKLDVYCVACGDKYENVI